MPMDGLTLSFLCRELDRALTGGRIDKISQPERDEIILTIRNNSKNYQLLLSASAANARAHLTLIKKANPLEPPMFCMLLRKHITSGRVSGVRQHMGDRILELLIDSIDELGDATTKTLLIEIMGKHSNIMLLRQDGRIIDSARHVTDDMSRVREVLPGLMYMRPPIQDKLPPEAVTPALLEPRLASAPSSLSKALGDNVMGLSGTTSKELAYRATGDEDAYVQGRDVPTLARELSIIIHGLEAETAPRLIYRGDPKSSAPIEFTAFEYLCRQGLPLVSMPSLSEAMDEFYHARDNMDRLQQKSQAMHRVLKNNIERCEKKLSLQLDALLDAGRMDEYRVMGELITASQHLIKKGMTKAVLPNYYAEDMAEIAVTLDDKLSPQQNAQRYFKRYQKARSAQQLAGEQREKTEYELNYLEGQLDNLSKCTAESELNEIRLELENEGYVKKTHNRRQLKVLPPSKPLHIISRAGIDILIGKNNLQNELLTQTAHALETWLHVKDMPGSHVIIVSENVDDETLVEAASYAAYYSKGRTGTHVPVDYTLRKYVKKPSGAKPGFVIYTHQRTLFVEPTAPVEA